MRILKCIPFLLLVSCSLPQTRKSVLTSPFEATWHVGDEDVIKHQLRVYTKSDQVWADKLLPFFYYGTQADSLWQVRLNRKQIRFCNAFLQKAHELPKQCDQNSTFMTEVDTPTDTLTINGECKWGKLGYYRLEPVLFKKQFKELRKKREALEQQLISTLNGRWYVAPVIDSISNDTTNRFTLHKFPPRSGENCVWQFSPKYSFKGNCAMILPMPFSKQYRFDIDEGSILLEIKSGGRFTKDYQLVDTNDGAMFEVITYHTGYFILDLLWR